MDGRVFGLDLQLGFDVICQAICIFLLFFLLSYILYEPVKKILRDRQEKIGRNLHLQRQIWKKPASCVKIMKIS